MVNYKQYLLQILRIAGIIASIFAIIWAFNDEIKAEPKYEEEVWVLCDPESYVNVRRNPNKKSEEIARLDCGDGVWTTNKKKNGFLYLFDLTAEYQSGWVTARYIVYDKPTQVNEYGMIRSNGKVACRKWINGKIKNWVRNGDLIKVYWTSEEWSITNRGYIKTEYIELTGQPI